MAGVFLQYGIKKYDNNSLSGNLEQDILLFKTIFKKDDVLRIRTVNINNSDVSCALIFLDGMINSHMLGECLVKPIVTAAVSAQDTLSADFVAKNILFANEVGQSGTLSDLLRAILYGDTVILVEHSTKALTVNTKGWRTRGISEPADERILQGPREGFDEAAMFNLAMIRRKLLTPDLCIEMQRVGRRTDTPVFVCYLESLADKKLVNEVKRRLSKIDIDGILDSNYIAENIRDHKYSLLKTSGTTERPDIVAARLLEGRIAIVVDGTPVVLTVPYLFSENFQSDEDYYLNFFVASIGRALRYICFFAAVSVPAIFVALITFHFQLLPTHFALSIAQLRYGVPMSSVTEAVILILIFEILKETGIRMPQSLGHALSIVGGLVIGQAAVEAKIISAPMLIAVAASGISGLMVPRLKGIVFYLRLALVIAASLFGLFGYMALFSIFIIRTLSLTCFGTDYTLSLNKPDFQSLKDTFFRAPWPMMKLRPAFNKNAKRMDERQDI